MSVACAAHYGVVTRAWRRRNRHDVRIVRSLAWWPSPGRPAGGDRPRWTTAARRAARSSAPSVRTLLGPGVPRVPGRDRPRCGREPLRRRHGHCRVLVAARPFRRLDGLRGPGRPRQRRSPAAAAPARAPRSPASAWRSPRRRHLHRRGTAQRVQEIRRAAAAIAAGHRGRYRDGWLQRRRARPDRQVSSTSRLGVAVDAAGDLFIADTANCRVRVLPAADVTVLGRAVTAGELTTVAGTGVCGSAGQGGPLAAAQLSNPVAVTLDAPADLLVADGGNQSVLWPRRRADPSGGRPLSARATSACRRWAAWGYGPYLADGLSATGPTAELNDPRAWRSDRRARCSSATGSCTSSGSSRRWAARLLGRHMVAGHLNTPSAPCRPPVSSRQGQRRHPLGRHADGDAGRRGGVGVGVVVSTSATPA